MIEKEISIAEKEIIIAAESVQAKAEEMMDATGWDIFESCDQKYQTISYKGTQGRLTWRLKTENQALIYCTEGICEIYNAKKKLVNTLQEGAYHLSLLGNCTYQFVAKGKSNAIFIVLAQKDFIDLYLTPLQPESSNYNLPIPYHTLETINQILNSTIELPVKNLYYVGKIIVLFTHYMAQKSNYEAIKTKPITDREIEKIKLVKAQIDQNPEIATSLNILAKNAGTNVQYLKKHFKLLTDTTVGNYILNKRMEFAKNLLLTEDLKIAEVAYKSGFKQASYFSSCFKKHFGYLPQTLKAKGLSIANRMGKKLKSFWLFPILNLSDQSLLIFELI